MSLFVNKTPRLYSFNICWCIVDDRLRDVVVLVGTTMDSLQKCAYFPGPGQQGQVIELLCTEPIVGQFVVVRLEGQAMVLTLCEVEAYGFPVGGL